MGLYVTYVINQMKFFLLSNYFKDKCLSEFIMLTKLYAFIHDCHFDELTFESMHYDKSLFSHIISDY